MQVSDQLAGMDAQQLREFAADLIDRVTRQDQELRYKQLKIEQLTHEMAVLKRWKFAARSEQLHGVQRSLLDEAIDVDLEAIAAELETLRSPARVQAPKEQPKRSALPAHLPRVEVRHEPERTVCSCGCALKRIGEDVSEKLDYTPGVFHVERHIRGKWACAKCQTLIQAPVPAQVIDKGLPTAGLLAQYWWRNMRITSRCIGRKASSNELVLQYRARLLPNGSVLAACACSRWSMR